MFAQQNCTTAAAAARAQKRRRIAKLTLDSIRATNDPHVMTIYYSLQQIIINNNNNINCNNFPRGSFTFNYFPFVGKIVCIFHNIYTDQLPAS